MKYLQAGAGEHHFRRINLRGGGGERRVWRRSSGDGCVGVCVCGTGGGQWCVSGTHRCRIPRSNVHLNPRLKEYLPARAIRSALPGVHQWARGAEGRVKPKSGAFRKRFAKDADAVARRKRWRECHGGREVRNALPLLVDDVERHILAAAPLPQTQHGFAPCPRQTAPGGAERTSYGGPAWKRIWQTSCVPSTGCSVYDGVLLRSMRSG